MAANRPSRSPVQLPKATPGQPVSAELFNKLVRSLEQQLNALFQRNNQTSIIQPEATYSTSIAGDTASFNDLRDFTLTVVNALKNNNILN